MTTRDGVSVADLAESREAQWLCALETAAGLAAVGAVIMK